MSLTLLLLLLLLGLLIYQLLLILNLISDSYMLIFLHHNPSPPWSSTKRPRNFEVLRRKKGRVNLYSWCNH